MPYPDGTVLETAKNVCSDRYHLDSQSFLQLRNTTVATQLLAFRRLTRNRYNLRPLIIRSLVDREATSQPTSRHEITNHQTLRTIPETPPSPGASVAAEGGTRAAAAAGAGAGAAPAVVAAGLEAAVPEGDPVPLEVPQAPAALEAEGGAAGVRDHEA